MKQVILLLALAGLLAACVAPNASSPASPTDSPEVVVFRSPT